MCPVNTFGIKLDIVSATVAEEITAAIIMYITAI